MPRPTLDETYLQIAEIVAKRATCPRRQVGCVITDANGRILSTGYNGVAHGQPHCIDTPCPAALMPSGAAKDLACEAIHAEQNACLFLKEPRQADTIYLTISPCITCVKLLLGTAAQRIVLREHHHDSGGAILWMSAGRQIIRIPA